MSVEGFRSSANLPQPFFWSVMIQGPENLPEFTPGRDLVNIAAQEVTVPSETASFADFGQENRGGFMPALGMDQRESFLGRNITINFLEMAGGDVEHNFLRPWLVAISTFGLINGFGRGLVKVEQMTNSGAGLRKSYTMERAFPTNCEGFSVNYGTQDFVQKTVTFAGDNLVLG